MENSDEVKLNVGAGTRQRRGYISCDIRAVDASTVMCNMWEVSVQFTDVSEIYSRHALEHLTFDEANLTLKDWYKALKEGGKLRIIIPNMDKHIEEWQYAVWDEASYTNNLSVLGRMRGGIYGWQRESDAERQEGMYWDCHKSGYNQQAITFFLQRAGFTRIQTGVSKDGYHLTAVAYKLTKGIG